MDGLSSGIAAKLIIHFVAYRHGSCGADDVPLNSGQKRNSFIGP